MTSSSLSPMVFQAQILLDFSDALGDINNLLEARSNCSSGIQPIFPTWSLIPIFVSLLIHLHCQLLKFCPQASLFLYYLSYWDNSIHPSTSTYSTIPSFIQHILIDHLTRWQVLCWDLVGKKVSKRQALTSRNSGSFRTCITETSAIKQSRGVWI